MLPKAFKELETKFDYSDAFHADLCKVVWWVKSEY